MDIPHPDQITIPAPPQPWKRPADKGSAIAVSRKTAVAPVAARSRASVDPLFEIIASACVISFVVGLLLGAAAADVVALVATVVGR